VIMLPFALEKVHSAEEAITAAAAGGRYIAGGTTLIDLMREEVERPERLIDINALPLGGVRVEDGDVVSVPSPAWQMSPPIPTCSACSRSSPKA